MAQPRAVSALTSGGREDNEYAQGVAREILLGSGG